MNIFKSKTVVFSILLAVLSVLQGYIGLLPLDQKGHELEVPKYMRKLSA